MGTGGTPAVWSPTVVSGSLEASSYELLAWLILTSSIPAQEEKEFAIRNSITWQLLHYQITNHQITNRNHRNLSKIEKERLKKQSEDEASQLNRLGQLNIYKKA